jgi:hypothetical protein
MYYFCTVSNRVGTCYHEFYKGKWVHKTFWKSDSILLHDDTLEELGLYKAFAAVLPDYDRYGETQVNQSQWESILDYASQLDTEAKAALSEATAWVGDVFENGEVFTILGI